MKKVLVLGGTGVMGAYLVDDLLALGFKVDAVSLDDMISANPNLRYFKGNCKDEIFLTELLKNDYDSIVDFMMYQTEEFRQRYELFLKNTDQYIFLSSYRIYANEEIPILETSPRLLDVSPDKEYLASDDYSLYKAREEDILKNSGYTNWTVVRPAITYSKQRIQLTCLEANTIINRARMGKPVVVARDALSHEATMTWGGDVAKMISRLVCNKSALQQAYTTATAEHHSWETVAGYYKELIGLSCVAVDLDEFLSIKSDEEYNPYKWKVMYDRMYDRIVDNTKILNAAGMKQSELMPLFSGLKQELARVPANMVIGTLDYSRRMDEFLENRNIY